LAQETLLSISEASHLLGVSEAALRQWTDEGKVKAFITPGGHRRYNRNELKKFMVAHYKTFGIKDLVIELAETAQQHGEIAQATLKKTDWYDSLDEEAQAYLADLGRLMLNLIIKYITETSHREETIKLVRDAGRDHGEMLAKLGLPLTDSVEAFLLHRDPMMNATTHMMRKREAFTGRVVEAIPMVAHVMDEALVALVAAHQYYHNNIKADNIGGATG
jgi:excisionase family DNA binding protein